MRLDIDSFMCVQLPFFFSFFPSAKKNDGDDEMIAPAYGKFAMPRGPA